MGSRAGGRRTGPKCVAIVGPFASGKSTLLEAILARTGAVQRQNPVGSGNTVTDHSAEARAHAMSVEATVATTSFMGESLTFIDCPGSIEFAYEAEPVLAACDLAVVVAEADEKKIPALQLVMRKLDELGERRGFHEKTGREHTVCRKLYIFIDISQGACPLWHELLARNLQKRGNYGKIGHIGGANLTVNHFHALPGIVDVHDKPAHLEAPVACGKDAVRINTCADERPRPESNRDARMCSPLRNHSATRPQRSAQRGS